MENQLPTEKEQREQLKALAFTKMPFGKYKGKYLYELPEAYLVWFSQKGFPENKLGQQLQLMLEIKANGLEGMIKKIAQSSF